MASHQTLQAEKREVKGTTASRRLRKAGIVPAVVYGSSQREYMIQTDAKIFGDILRKQSSTNFLVDLQIEGAREKTKLAIVQDIQRDPLSGQLVHIDFRAVSEDETIHAVVPVDLEGEPAGVKEGGVLEQQIHSIEVHCLPGNLPERIVHNVEEVKLDESVRISELNLPEGVSATLDGEVIVALVAEPRVVELPTPDEAAEGEADAEAAESGEGESPEGSEEKGDGEENSES